MSRLVLSRESVNSIFHLLRVVHLWYDVTLLEEITVTGFYTLKDYPEKLRLSVC